MSASGRNYTFHIYTYKKNVTKPFFYSFNTSSRVYMLFQVNGHVGTLFAECF